MEIVRIPKHYLSQFEYLDAKQCEYVLKTIFKVANGEQVELEPSITGGLVHSILREAIQMEDRAKSKKGKDSLKIDLPPMGQPKLKTGSTQLKSSKVNSIQVKPTQKIIPKGIEETSELPSYGNKEINETLGFLTKTVGVDQFKETVKMQRQYGNHIVNFVNKHGKEDFIQRLKGILSDEFKANNCNSIKYLYNEIKSYRHSPIEQKPKITVI